MANNPNCPACRRAPFDKRMPFRSYSVMRDGKRVALINAQTPEEAIHFFATTHGKEESLYTAEPFSGNAVSAITRALNSALEGK